MTHQEWLEEPYERRALAQAQAEEADRIEEERKDLALKMTTENDYLEVLSLTWEAAEDLGMEDQELNRRIVLALLTVPEVRAAVRDRV